jgi:hypothetical protein
VTEARTCRYRIFGESAINSGRDKMASLHQGMDEPLERYIRRAQKLTVACEGRDEMHEELTSRFCRGLREKGHRNSLAAMADIWAQIGRTRFETCISNAYRIARSDISYKEALLLTDSDLSEDDRKYRKKRRQKERRKRKEQKEKNRREKTRKDEKSPMRSPTDPLEEKLKEVQKMKEVLLEKKIEELRELASQAKIVPAGPVTSITPPHLYAGPVTPTTPNHPYAGPLGYGVLEPHGIQSNLIETGRQDWTANNPDIVCYNCETPGHYESRCWKPRVAPEIRAENVLRINATSGRRRSYPLRYGQGGNGQRYGQGGNEQRWEPYQPDVWMH